MEFESHRNIQSKGVRQAIGGLAKSLPPPQVWSYESARAYLQDWLEWKRMTSPKFSVRQFCLKAGSSTENYLGLVIAGRKRLGTKMALQFSQVLGLKNGARDHFLELAEMDRVSNADEQSRLQTRLEARRRRYQRSEPVLDHSILRHWYLGAAWELASCKDVPFSPQSIAERLMPAITTYQAREAFEYLKQKGYIVEREGRWVQSEIQLTTTSGIPDSDLKHHHREVASLAGQWIDAPLIERGFFGLTIALERHQLPQVKARIKELQDKLQEEFSLNPKADRVYRLNFQVFPMSK